MEFKSLSLALIGVFGFLFWFFDFFKVFRRSALVAPNSKRKNKSLLRGLVFIMGAIAWVLISVSLTQPRKPLSFDEGNIEVRDIYLVLDVSRSMLAEDLNPNRIEVAKRKLREFAELRPKDRIGVIIFSEKVFTLLPLTTDSELINKVMGQIQVGYLGSGTNIGDALGLGVARSQMSKTKKKVIILLTDGVNNVGNLTPLQAAEQAKEFGIRVYTIGLGTDKNARLPIGNGIFGKRYANIPGGSIDLKTLQEISKLTGGKSYKAKSENALKDILGEIEQLERSKIKINNRVVYKEYYYLFFFPGLLILMLVEFTRRLAFREVL
jgi:Ca-activated chloride channel family protein